VEHRQDMVTLCNEAPEKLDQPGFTFAHGDVSNVAPRALDVIIALHASDNATHYAMHKGIRSGASIINCSPYSHKQIRLQIQS
ncbi:methyltransferase, partial [Pseudomonas syringae group genomosp. 7]|uniref:methyltransferase n=1 Tax=Pseudomonas syringae group genomosp. 7 TaxID=251699 RepID=UPI00376F7B9B